MSGLNYLLNALASADSEAWLEIENSLTWEVNFDRWEHFDFWAKQTTANTGVGFLDRMLSAVMQTTSDAVNTVYDSYLKS